MDTTLPFFGESVANSVKDFQAAKGLKVDGQVGPVTAKELFRPRVEHVEYGYGIPDGALGKQIWLESAFDPVAVGTVDSRDRGMCQINLFELTNASGEHGAHHVTLAQAYDPPYAIDWAGQYIISQQQEIADRIKLMKAARAAYNVGDFYAAQWLLDGFPASGKVVDGIDWYKRATDYLFNIDRQTW
jgi:peptidoglycan hydrolase-like protein with peptidoglycan-binding domain